MGFLILLTLLDSSDFADRLLLNPMDDWICSRGGVGVGIDCSKSKVEINN